MTLVFKLVQMLMAHPVTLKQDTIFKYNYTRGWQTAACGSHSNFCFNLFYILIFSKHKKKFSVIFEG